MSVRSWAYVRGGTVVNTARSTPENVAAYQQPYDAAIDITDAVPRPGPGWLHDGTAFSPPPPPPEPAPEPEPGPEPTDPIERILWRLDQMGRRLDALERRP